MSQSLPQPRIVRTAHNKDSISIFAADTHLPPFQPFGPQGSGFTIFDARSSIPVNNLDATSSFENKLPRCPPSGAIFCISDYKAGCVVPMHRTLSIDYCFVLSGEIVIRLDGGDEKIVKAGEVIVQQGANHQWFNRTEETCRILFVMLGAEKIVTREGEVLEETAFKR